MSSKTVRAKQLTKLRKETGIDLPEMKPANYVVGAPAQEARILQYAIEHGFVITPNGYTYFVDSWCQLHCCPCAPSRKSCPCPEAEEEVKTQGHCTCRLFWRDYKAYQEKMKVG